MRSKWKCKKGGEIIKHCQFVGLTIKKNQDNGTHWPPDANSNFLIPIS